MSEPEKYTLDRVLEIVQYHAAKLGTAGQSLKVTEGKDPEVLAMLGERALKASEALWAIDTSVGFGPSGECEGLFEAWYGDDSYGGAPGRARNVLPLISLATRGCHTTPPRIALHSRAVAVVPGTDGADR